MPFYDHHDVQCNQTLPLDMKHARLTLILTLRIHHITDLVTFTLYSHATTRYAEPVSCDEAEEPSQPISRLHTPVRKKRMEGCLRIDMGNVIQDSPIGLAIKVEVTMLGHIKGRSRVRLSLHDDF